MSSESSTLGVVCPSPSGPPSPRVPNSKSTKLRVVPNANSVRRHIPNRDKDFFDRLVENGRCTSWYYEHEEYYDDDSWDDNEDGSLWDGVIWSGNSPSRFFVGINVVVM